MKKLLLLLTIGMLYTANGQTQSQINQAINNKVLNASYLQKARAYFSSIEDVVLDDLWDEDERSKRTTSEWGCWVVSETCYGDGPCVDDPCEPGYRRVTKSIPRPKWFRSWYGKWYYNEYKWFFKKK